MAQRHEEKLRKKEGKQRKREEKARILSEQQFADWKASKPVENFPTLHAWKEALYDGEYATRMSNYLNATIKANDHDLSSDEHFEIVRECSLLKKRTVDAQNRADVMYALIHAHMTKGLNEVVRYVAHIKILSWLD